MKEVDSTHFKKADVIAVAALAALVIYRTLPFFLYPGIHFDSDQAVFGLMTSHLIKLQALPVFMYGQKYFLAVQTWFAVPFFLAFGATLLSLKLTTLVLNLLTVATLFYTLKKSLEFSTRFAFFISLTLALPALSLSQQWMNFSGGHIEPMLYALALYLLRKQTFRLAVLSAIAVMHREYCLAAVLSIWIIRFIEEPKGQKPYKDLVKFTFGILGSVTLVQWVARHFSANYFGSAPPFKINHTLQGYLESFQWIGRHLALVLGGTFRTDETLAIPFQDGSLLVGAALIGLTFLTLTSITQKVDFKRFLFSLYLFLISAMVCGFYLLKLQSHDGLTMRYLLMAAFIPLACAVPVLSDSRKWIRTSGITLITLISAFHAYDVGRYWHTLNVLQPIDEKGEIAKHLEEQKVQFALAPYWTSYNVTFRTLERVQVGSTEQVRISTYQRDPATCLSKIDSVQVCR